MENNNKLLKDIRKLLISIDSKIDGGDEPSPEPTPTPTGNMTAYITLLDPNMMTIEGMEYTITSNGEPLDTGTTGETGLITLKITGGNEYTVYTNVQPFNYKTQILHIDTTNTPPQYWINENNPIDIDTSVDYVDISINF